MVMNLDLEVPKLPQSEQLYFLRQTAATSHNFHSTNSRQKISVCVTEVSYWITYFQLLLYLQQKWKSISITMDSLLPSWITIIPKILYIFLFSSLFQLTFFQNFTNSLFLPLFIPNEFPECPLLSLQRRSWSSSWE